MEQPDVLCLKEKPSVLQTRSSGAPYYTRKEISGTLTDSDACKCFCILKELELITVLSCGCATWRMCVCMRALFQRKNITWHCVDFIDWLTLEAGTRKKLEKIRDKVWLESPKESGETNCALVGKNRHRGNIVKTLKWLLALADTPEMLKEQRNVTPQNGRCGWMKKRLPPGERPDDPFRTTASMYNAAHFVGRLVSWRQFSSGWKGAVTPAK